MEKDMEKGYKFGMMVQNMKENGKMISQMDMEHFIKQVEMFIKEIGRMIKQMVKEYI
jgi:hypothetical protein